MADAYMFDLDLLTSFDVRSISGGGQLSADEGIRRFRTMISDRTLGEIVRVRLRVEPSTVVITDIGTNADLEHIPLSLISQIVAISDRSCAPYENILVFTVLEDSFQLAPPEMYFFQCLNASAQRLVDTLTAAAAGKLRFSRKSLSTVPPNSASRKTSAENQKMLEYEQQAQRSAKATSTYRPGPAPGEMFRQSINVNDPMNERTNQNIKILDHCLDDIEKFVARLQQAADAFKKLEKRRVDRQVGNNAVGPGDGMLIMRARPPPVLDFISIFQKFKLAFNLLASLKGFIHNPNAPEMIHFLFTPLGLVVDASKDPNTGLPALADRVVSPLLTPEAVQLLSDCLTSRENQLWMSLGDAWTHSRDHYKGPPPPLYLPVFSDGWSPPPYWMEDPSAQLPPGPVAGEHSSAVHRSNVVVDENPPYRWDQKSAENKPPEPSREPKRSSAIYPISEVTGVVDEKQQKYVWELMARGAKIFMLVETYAAANPKELTARKGELVEILDDSRNWWHARNAAGNTGYLPRTLLTPYVQNDPHLFTPYEPKPMQPSPKSNRSSYNGGDHVAPAASAAGPPISSRVYQEPVVQRSASTAQPAVDRRSAQYVDPLAADRRSLPPPGDRRSGYADAGPADRRSAQYAELPPGPPVAAVSSRTSAYSDNGGRNSYIDDRHASVAAAANVYQDLPLSHRSSDSDPADPHGLGESWDSAVRPYPRTAVDDLNDEFRHKMSVPGALTKPVTKPKPQTVYLHQDSTPEEILYWLQVKGFSYEIQEELCRYDSKKLFGMSRASLERMFGADEGGRLYSQLLVQKNRSGFKTARSAELQAILKQRKRISDVSGPLGQNNNQSQQDFDGEQF